MRPRSQGMSPGLAEHDLAWQEQPDTTPKLFRRDGSSHCLVGHRLRADDFSVGYNVILV